MIKRYSGIAIQSTIIDQYWAIIELEINPNSIILQIISIWRKQFNITSNSFSSYNIFYSFFYITQRFHDYFYYLLSIDAI